jgi:hypothetical protein
VQGDRQTGVQHGLQREQRQLHRANSRLRGRKLYGRPSTPGRVSAQGPARGAPSGRVTGPEEERARLSTARGRQPGGRQPVGWQPRGRQALGGVR